MGLSRPALPSTPITPPRITLPPPNTTPKTMMSSSQVATSIAIDRRHNPTRLYSKPKQQTVSLMNLSSTTRSWKKKDKKKILISVDLETVIQFAPYYYYYTMILISSRPAQQQPKVRKRRRRKMILAANLHYYYYYNSYYYYVPAKIKHEEEFTTILEPKNHPSLLLLVSLSRSPLSLMLTTSSTSSISLSLPILVLKLLFPGLCCCNCCNQQQLYVADCLYLKKNLVLKLHNIDYYVLLPPTFSCNGCINAS